MVQDDTTWVKFKGEGHGSKFTVAGGKNAKEVVSVTSSASFLVKLTHGKPPVKLQHVILVAKRSQVKIHPVHYKLLTY